MTDFEKQANHSAQQAITAGWWAYAENSVQALETQKTTADTFKGLRAAVGLLVKAQGYRPSAHELRELK